MVAHALAHARPSEVIGSWLRRAAGPFQASRRHAAAGPTSGLLAQEFLTSTSPPAAPAHSGSAARRQILESRTRLARAWDGVPGLYTFGWSTGATGTPTSLTLSPGQILNISVNAVNRLDGRTLTATRQFIAAPARARTLYATSIIESWSTFFDGAPASVRPSMQAPICRPAASSRVLPGTSSPSEERTRWHAPGIAGAVIDRGNRGFTVTRTAFGLESLDVLVTACHNGGSAIRVRPVYFVQEPAGVDCNSGGATQGIP